MSEVEYCLKSDYDKLLKDFKKLQRQVKKLTKTLKVDTDEDKPKRLNGFAKPTRISDELAAFLGVEKDTEIARTEVTKKLNVYIKENNLQNQENKKHIILDDKLKQLILVPDDVDLTFFNLQKYIKHHYKPALEVEGVSLKVNVESKPEPEPEPASAPDTEKTKSPKKVVRKKVVKK